MTDELIEAIASSGGIIGITGFPGFLVYEGQPTMEQFVSHVDHVASVAGINHVGLPNLTKALLEHGYSVADTRKIIGLNWVGVYDRIWN